MSGDEAIKIISECKENGLRYTLYTLDEYQKALDMAIEALQMGEDALKKLSYLTDRPCEVCKAHGRDGCGLWTCVFTSVQPTQEVGRWIPCSERLPEDIGKLYLVCFNDGYISSVEYDMDGDRVDWLLWQESGEVVAWMPLPEPWKEGE